VDLSSGGAVILAIAYLTPMFYLGYSLFFGKRAHRPIRGMRPGLNGRRPRPHPSTILIRSRW
jgi:cytochrome c oxidase subunit 1